MARDEDIAHYYDANTGKFLRFGGSGDVAAIHRAIWAPGVSNRHQAFRYLNELVAASAQELAESFAERLRILDLGCGVGGTATFLHHRLGAEVLGISLSETQVARARARALQFGCGDQVRFETASFEAFCATGQFHAACAIESFVHCQDPGRFLDTVRLSLLPGGRLIVCDDFIDPAAPLQAKEWLQRFRQGWNINTLLSSDAFGRLATDHGFRLLNTADLSAYIRPFPGPVLLFLSQITRLPLPWAYWQNLAGGTALQVCLQRGFSRYHAVVLERR